MIHQLIYTSSRAGNLGDAELDALLLAARENNTRLGLTGVLLCTNDQFMQVLEGSRDALEQLFARIVADPRHEDVRVVIRRRVTKRDFANWQMALRDARAKPLAPGCELVRFFEADFDVQALPDASPTGFLLRAFRDIELGAA